MKQTDSMIYEFVQTIRRRLRIKKILHRMGTVWLAGMCICILLSLISCKIPFYAVHVVQVLVLLIATLAGLVWGLIETPSMMESALFADRFGYQEKFSTALSLKGKEGVLERLQKNDAVACMQQFEIKEHVPLQVSKKRCGMLLLLTILCVATNAIPTTARQMAADTHALQEEKKQEERRLRQSKKELLAQQNLKKTEVSEIKEMYETAKAQVKAATTKEELQQAEQRLQKKLEDAKSRTKNETLSKQLAKEAKEAEKRAGNQNGDSQSASSKQTGSATAGSQSGEANEKDSQQGNAQNQPSSQAQKSSEGSANAQSSGSQNNPGNSDGDAASDKGNQSNQAGQGEQSNPNGQNGNGTGWNQGDKKGSEGPKKTGEVVTIPKGKIGTDENLTGKDNGNQKESQKEKSKDAKAWDGDRIEYGEVVTEYKEKALQQTERAQYPGEMKEKIKQYFDGL